MTRPGRKSAAERAIAPLAGAVTASIAKYPRPPRELTPAEASVWREVVRCKSPDWFDGSNYALLVQYCRHVIRAQRLADLATAIEDDLDRQARGLATIAPVPDLGYLDLLRVQQAESRCIAMLATKMRLAQQSSLDPQNAKNGVGKKSASGHAIEGELWDG